MKYNLFLYGVIGACIVCSNSSLTMDSGEKFSSFRTASSLFAPDDMEPDDEIIPGVAVGPGDARDDLARMIEDSMCWGCSSAHGATRGNPTCSICHGEFIIGVLERIKNDYRFDLLSMAANCALRVTGFNGRTVARSSLGHAIVSDSDRSVICSLERAGASLHMVCMVDLCDKELRDRCKKRTPVMQSIAREFNIFDVIACFELVLGSSDSHKLIP